MSHGACAELACDWVPWSERFEYRHLIKENLIKPHARVEDDNQNARCAENVDSYSVSPNEECVWSHAHTLHVHIYNVSNICNHKCVCSFIYIYIYVCLILSCVTWNESEWRIGNKIGSFWRFLVQSKTTSGIGKKWYIYIYIPCSWLIMHWYYNDLMGYQHGGIKETLF